MTPSAGWQEGHAACKKTEWCGAGVVICLERGADLHMTQPMPLPLTVSCFSKIQGPDLQNILRQSYDYLTIMPKLRSTYDSDLKSAKISFRNIVSYFGNTVSDDLTTLQVNLYLRKALRPSWDVL